MSVIGDKPKNDIYYSTGGGPEGVIVAAALSCYGGQIQGRLVLDEEEKFRAKKLGITEFRLSHLRESGILKPGDHWKSSPYGQKKPWNPAALYNILLCKKMPKYNHGWSKYGA